MPGKQVQSSKRQQVRMQREKKQRQQRITVVAVIAGFALLLIAFVVWNQVQSANQPIGEVIPITPIERPFVDGRALGSEDAKVVIEVFEDFQCPSCKNFSSSIEPQIINELVAAGNVRYVFRHYPFIDNAAPGSESDQAAHASMCASDMGRFWDYKDILYANWDGENQGSFSDKRLIAFAEKLGLDMEAFQACFDENPHEEMINADYELGQQMGVSGTPSVFVNQVQVATVPNRVPSYEEIKAAVQAALAANN
jgi:protein-disulfide isomerase